MYSSTRLSALHDQRATHYDCTNRHDVYSSVMYWIYTMYAQVFSVKAPVKQAMFDARPYAQKAVATINTTTTQGM